MESLVSIPCTRDRTLNVDIPYLWFVESCFFMQRPAPSDELPFHKCKEI